MRSFFVLVWQCLTQWHVPSTSLEGAEAILVHAAGENTPTDPGAVNAYMATLVRELHMAYNIPVIVQGEIAPCLDGIPLHAKSFRQAEVAPRYLSSLDLTRWFKSECDQLGVNRVILVSYEPHYWRAVRIAQRLGFTVLVPNGIRELYDPDNSQVWARSKWLNRAYELLVARPYFLWKGML